MLSTEPCDRGMARRFSTWKTKRHAFLASGVSLVPRPGVVPKAVTMSVARSGHGRTTSWSRALGKHLLRRARPPGLGSFGDLTTLKRVDDVGDDLVVEQGLPAGPAGRRRSHGGTSPPALPRSRWDDRGSRSHPVGASPPVREQIPDQPLGLGLIVRERLGVHVERRVPECLDGLGEPPGIQRDEPARGIEDLGRAAPVLFEHYRLGDPEVVARSARRSRDRRRSTKKSTAPRPPRRRDCDGRRPATSRMPYWAKLRSWNSSTST